MLSGSCFSTLSDLYDQLNASGDHEFHHVEKYCPIDPSLKYSLMKTIKSNGFPFSTALLTYMHGNNVGNLSFLWKVHSNDESAFSHSQSVIEHVKEYIPTYHTRTMRKEMFQRFGRLTSSVKPAVMRFIYRSLTGKPCKLVCI